MYKLYKAHRYANIQYIIIIIIIKTQYGRHNDLLLTTRKKQSLFMKPGITSNIILCTKHTGIYNQ